MIGAFGAHALEPVIVSHSGGGTWDTGIFYYWAHCLGLLALAFSTRAGDPQWQRAVTSIAWIWLASIIVFSGSLFALALGGPRALGAITPIGGVGFIVGWALALFHLPGNRGPKSPGLHPGSGT